MANASRDDNRVPVLMGVSSADGVTLLPIKVNPATGRVIAEATETTEPQMMVALFESDVSVSTGNGRVALTIPAVYDGLALTAVIASVHTKGITATTDVMVRRRRAGSDVDMLTVPVTIGDEFYAADGTIDTDNDDVATGDQIYIDVDAVHSGTAPLGLSVTISFG